MELLGQPEQPTFSQHFTIYLLPPCFCVKDESNEIVLVLDVSEIRLIPSTLGDQAVVSASQAELPVDDTQTEPEASSAIKNPSDPRDSLLHDASMRPRTLAENKGFVKRGARV